MNLVQLLLAGLLVGGLAGCHRLLPFTEAPVDRGGDRATGRDRAPWEVGTGDGAPSAVERGPLPTDQQTADRWKNSDQPGPCPEPVEPIMMATACSQQCGAGGSVTDPDCDGLAGARDPWPGVCNRLIVDERFEMAPTSWQLTGHAGPSNTGPPCGHTTVSVTRYCSGLVGEPSACPLGSACMNPSLCHCQSAVLPALSCVGQRGFVELPASELFLTYRTKATFISNGTDLVEMSFELGAATTPANWSVGMRVASDFPSGQFRTCTLWVSSTSQPNPGIQVVAHASATIGAPNWTKSSNLPAGDGLQYILQSWAEGTIHTCRLLSADGTTVVTTISLPLAATLSTPGLLHIITSGRAARVDHVRVFTH